MLSVAFKRVQQSDCYSGSFRSNSWGQILEICCDFMVDSQIWHCELTWFLGETNNKCGWEAACKAVVKQRNIEQLSDTTLMLQKSCKTWMFPKPYVESWIFLYLNKASDVWTKHVCGGFWSRNTCGFVTILFKDQTKGLLVGGFNLSEISQIGSSFSGRGKNI